MALAALGRSMRPVSMAVMASIGPAAWIDAHRTVQPGEDAELDLGKAEPRPLLAVGDAPIAGQRQLEPAAEAIAVNGGDHRHRQAVDAVDELERLLHHLGDLGLGVEALELPDIGAGDEARTPCRSSAPGP